MKPPPEKVSSPISFPARGRLTEECLLSFESWQFGPMPTSSMLMGTKRIYMFTWLYADCVYRWSLHATIGLTVISWFLFTVELIALCFGSTRGSWLSRG